MISISERTRTNNFVRYWKSIILMWSIN